MILRVTQYGEPVLRKKGRKLTRFDRSLHKLADDMLATMAAAEGIGLAAQQVGLDLRIFVVDLQLTRREIDFNYQLDGRRPPLDIMMPLVVVNPELTLEPEPVAPYEEGCLSFPGLRGEIERPIAVTLRYQDLHGDYHELACNGLLARVLQHEYDHIEGVLFIDRMSPQVLRPLQPGLKRLKRQSRDFLKAVRKGEVERVG